MSAREASRFAPALRRVSGGLALPDAERTRVLLELAADLEAIYLHELGSGRSEEEASRLAEERVLATPEVVGRLVELHASGAGRWLRAVSGRMRSDLEPFLFAFAVLPMLLLAAVVLLRQVAAMSLSGWLLAVLGLFCAVVVLSARRAGELFGARRTQLRETREGLDSILFVGMLAPAIGALAMLVALHRLMETLSLTDSAPLPILVEFGQNTALFGSSLLLALTAATVWSFLSRRMAALEEAERLLLLGE